VFGADNAAVEATLANRFGINWSGADDLVTYIKSITIGGLDVNGCLVSLTGAMLSPNEQCKMYYLSSQGISTPSVYNITFNGKMLQTRTNNPFGLVVSNLGVPVRIVGVSAGTWQIQPGGQIVAAGAGNIILNDGGNIVAAGGGNIVAAGGGNIVAAGGGNIVNQNNAGIVDLQVLDPKAAAKAVGLISNNLPVISNDGGSFKSAITSLIHQDGSGLQNAVINGNSIGNNSSAITKVVTTNVLSGNGSALVSGTDGGVLIANAASKPLGNGGAPVISNSVLMTNNTASNIVVHGGDLPPSSGNSNGATYSVQSLGGSQPAAKPVPVSTVSITGPYPWPSGKSQVAVTWRVNGLNPPSCARGYQVMLNYGGLMADGSSHQMSDGMSLVTGLSWPRGSKFTISLYSLCTNPPSPVTAPFSTTIQ
jgi:hypothetical protein